MSFFEKGFRTPPTGFKAVKFKSWRGGYVTPFVKGPTRTVTMNRLINITKKGAT